MRQPDLFDLLERPVCELAQIRKSWTVPPIDYVALHRIEEEGRSPFGGEDSDMAQIGGVAEETMNSLVSDLLNLAGLDRKLHAGLVAFRNLRAWQRFQQEFAAERQTFSDSYEATLDALMEIWGFDGRDEFDREASRRAEGWK